MKFCANITKNVMAIKHLLIYRFYYQHVLEIVGAKKNKKSVI